MKKDLKDFKETKKDLEDNGRKFSDAFIDKIEKLEDSDLKKGLQKDMKVIEGSKEWKENFGKILGDLSRNRKENYVDGLIKREIAENPELKDLIDKRSEFRVQINEADAKIKNLGDEKIDKTNATYDTALNINKGNVEKVADYEKKALAGRAGKAVLNKMVPASNFISNRLGIETEREGYKKALKSVKEFNNLETTKDFEKFVKKNTPKKK
jgi:hypothetical protein